MKLWNKEIMLIALYYLLLKIYLNILLISRECGVLKYLDWTTI